MDELMVNQTLIIINVESAFYSKSIYFFPISNRPTLKNFEKRYVNSMFAVRRTKSLIETSMYVTKEIKKQSIR